MSLWNLVWLVWLAVGVGLEVPAILDKTPWVTFSQNVWFVEHKWVGSVVLFGSGIMLLFTHIVFHVP